MVRKGPSEYHDESVPVHPEGRNRHPLVVFGNHSFCAGETLDVMPMPSPHMHNQIELNFVLEGEMTYWFDGRMLSVGEGRLAVFWGMIPHQVTECEDPTRFVCLYVPMSVFLGLPTISRLRDAIFRGAMVEALDIRPYDRDIFLRWREELHEGDKAAADIVKDELTARIRRLDREGWQDLRNLTAAQADNKGHDAGRLIPVERMARFIGEHAVEDISVDDVAAAAKLHPNYAMSLFKNSVGITINQSIIRHRLDVAQSLLIASDRSVAEIAFESGFGSLSSFYAAFEQRFAASPASFRRKFKAQTLHK